MKVEKIACQTHITALHYHQGKLFVGVGQDLEIYSLSGQPNESPGEPIRFHVFDCFSIHGINVYEAGNRFVVLHGDRFFSLYELIESRPVALRLVKDKINLYDWILEVQFREGRIYALLTSNRLAIFDLETHRSKFINCPEKFTLYAAKFLISVVPNFERAGHLRVAAGTVFSEILICSYSASDCTITERLGGHDGALFSIDYRPELQLLASASDDRTVRLWSGGSGRFVCSQVLYGHESRIWQVKLTSNCIISIGEISSLFFWSYEGAKCLFKERSKKISYWKLAVDEENRRLFYGASDGSIKHRSIDDAIRENRQIELATDNAKWFRFFREKESDAVHLIVTQSDGRVKVFDTGNEQNERTVCEFDFGRAFSNYNVLAVEPNANRAMLGNIRGEVVRFELNSEQRKIETIGQRTLADHKLVNLFVVTHENERELVACGPNGEVVVSGLGDWNAASEAPVKFKLPAFKYQQVNCVLKLSKTVIAFGDRSGNVIVYKSQTVVSSEDESAELAAGKRFVMIKLFKKAHSLVGGCKQLIRHPFQQKFYSCGRDGRILEYDFDERRPDEDRQVDLLRSIKPSIEMDAIGRIEFDPIGGQLVYVIGHRQNMFVVWNNHTQSIVWTVQASGSTKPCDFAISSSKLNFVYLTRNRLLYACKPLDQSALLRPKHHSSTVLCAQPLFLKRKSSGHLTKLYFLTGCEDGEVFVNSFDAATGRTAVEAILHGHVSNVRTCLVEEEPTSSDCAETDSRCLAITAGSASNLMAWHIELDSDGKIRVKQLLNYFIWGPDRETMNRPWIKKPKQQLDSQLRFMDISLRRLSGQAGYLLSAVCSDATLRLFALSPAGSFIHLLGTYGLSSYCPLKLLDLGRCSLVTATDGSLRLVEFDFDRLAVRTGELVRNRFPANPLAIVVNDSEESALDLNRIEQSSTGEHPLRLLDTVQPHRFGINSLDSIEIEPGKVLVFSAGEDTSIGYTLISFEQDSESGGSARVLCNGSCPSKHSSMVSKVKVLTGGRLLTASWDQRIKIWQFSLDENGVQLRWLRTIVSSIADISEVLVFADQINRVCEINQGQTDQTAHRAKIDQESGDQTEAGRGQVILVALGEGEEIYKIDLRAGAQASGERSTGETLLS